MAQQKIAALNLVKRDRAKGTTFIFRRRRGRIGGGCRREKDKW